MDLDYITDLDKPFFFSKKINPFSENYANCAPCFALSVICCLIYH